MSTLTEKMWRKPGDFMVAFSFVGFRFQVWVIQSLNLPADYYNSVVIGATALKTYLFEDGFKVLLLTSFTKF